MVNTQRRVNLLIQHFADYLRKFDDARLFSGPSVHFHSRAIQARHRHDTATAALKDEQFLEYLYATLTAWGMHRMGKQKAKLVDFISFKKSLSAQ